MPFTHGDEHQRADDAHNAKPDVPLGHGAAARTQVRSFEPQAAENDRQRAQHEAPEDHPEYPADQPGDGDAIGLARELSA